jgi:hypothetical protein
MIFAIFLDTSVLLDLLAIHTAEYTSMMTNNVKNEAFENCQATIALLQTTINSRLQGPENTNITENGFEFTTGTTE